MGTKRSLSLFSAVIMTMVLIGSAGPAAADSQRQPLPFDDVTSPCPNFDVLQHAVSSNNYLTQRTTQSGTTIIKISGTLVLELTNLTSHKSITLNASGPGTITVNPDASSVTEGRGLTLVFLDPVTAAAFKMPMISYLSGRLVLAADPTGTATAISYTGNFRDVCAMLS